MTKQTTGNEIKKTTDEKTKETKPKTPAVSTIDITLINSTGKIIHATGACSDKEFKAYCRMIHSCESQKINLSNSV